MVALALCVVLSQAPNPYAGMAWKGPLPGSLDKATYQRIWSRAMKTAGTKPAPKASFALTEFKPVQPRSVAQAVVSSSSGVTKGQGKALVEGLDAGLDFFEEAPERKNNVAQAVAFLLGNCLQLVNNREFTNADGEWLAQAVNDELAASAPFKKLPAKEKQLLYETSIVVGALIGGMAAHGFVEQDVGAQVQARAMAKLVLDLFAGK
jgi:hypothetical protein